MTIPAWTYSTLLQALQDWPVHASPKYLAEAPNLIGLGERRLWGDLNIEEYDKEDKIAVQMSIGSRYVSKPTDVIQVRTAGYLDGSSNFQDMELRSYEWCQFFAPLSATQGLPLYYAEFSSSQIYVVPTPNAAFQMVYRYIGTPPETLSASTPNVSTWLSRAGPDALLAACLAEAEHFIKADDRYNDMMTKYNNELLPRLRAEVRKSIRAGDYGPLRSAAVVAQ